MTKEQLKAYRHLKLERDRLLLMIDELEAQMRNPRSQKLDGMPKGPSAPGSAVENLVCKHVELMSLYGAKVGELTVAAQNIEAAIEVLEPRERTLIRLHYIEGMTWEEVCVAMSYSWKQIHRIHGKALELLKGVE